MQQSLFFRLIWNKVCRTIQREQNWLFVMQRSNTNNLQNTIFVQRLERWSERFLQNIFSFNRWLWFDFFSGVATNQFEIKCVDSHSNIIKLKTCHYIQCFFGSSRQKEKNKWNKWRHILDNWLYHWRRFSQTNAI